MLLRITSAYPNALDTIPGHTEYLVISVKHSQINGNKKNRFPKDVLSASKIGVLILHSLNDNIMKYGQ